MLAESTILCWNMLLCCYMHNIIPKIITLAIHQGLMPSHFTSPPPPSCLGLVVVTDSPSGEMDDHVTELLTQHLLESATGLATSPPLSDNHFRKVPHKFVGS